MINGWEEFEVEECDECGLMLSTAELRIDQRSNLYMCAACVALRESPKVSRKKVLDLPPHKEERSI